MRKTSSIGPDPNHAGLGEKTVVNVVGTGHGPGVAGAASRPGFGAAHILGHDRLVPGDAPGRFQKPFRTANAFDVKPDGAGLFIRSQVFETVDQIDVGLVADADGLADADAPIPHPAQHLGRVGAALGGDAQMPRRVLQRGRR